jgi:hypothetical protein
LKQQKNSQHYGGSETKKLKGFDLLSFAKEIKISDDGKKLWDPTRQKWISIAPEETVRLSLVHLLKTEHNVSFRRMSTERSVDNASRRYDLLTFDQFGAPHLLIECKSPETQLKIEHIVQLGTYNDSLNASYALLTNGIDSLLINISTGEFLETLSDCFGTNS